MTNYEIPLAVDKDFTHFHPSIDWIHRYSREKKKMGITVLYARMDAQLTVDNG